MRRMRERISEFMCVAFFICVCFFLHFFWLFYNLQYFDWTDYARVYEHIWICNPNVLNIQKKKWREKNTPIQWVFLTKERNKETRAYRLKITNSKQHVKLSVFGCIWMAITIVQLSHCYSPMKNIRFNTNSYQYMHGARTHRERHAHYIR